MPTIERFDSEGRETLPEHRAAMNAPMRPHHVTVDDVRVLFGAINDIRDEIGRDNRVNVSAAVDFRMVSDKLEKLYA